MSQKDYLLAQQLADEEYARYLQQQEEANARSRQPAQHGVVQPGYPGTAVAQPPPLYPPPSASAAPPPSVQYTAPPPAAQYPAPPPVQYPAPAHSTTYYTYGPTPATVVYPPQTAHVVYPPSTSQVVYHTTYTTPATSCVVTQPVRYKTYETFKCYHCCRYIDVECYRHYHHHHRINCPYCGRFLHRRGECSIQ